MENKLNNYPEIVLSLNAMKNINSSDNLQPSQRKELMEIQIEDIRNRIEDLIDERREERFTYL